MSDEAVEAVAKRLQAHRSRSDSGRRAKKARQQRVSRAIRAALSRGE